MFLFFLIRYPSLKTGGDELVVQHIDLKFFSHVKFKPVVAAARFSLFHFNAEKCTHPFYFFKLYFLEKNLNFIYNIFAVPTPVRNLEAYPMNDRVEQEGAVAVIRWDKPRDYNGDLIGYTVEICSINPDGTVQQRESCPVRLSLEFFRVSI